MSTSVSGISTTFVPTSADEAVSMTSAVSEAESAFRAQVARARLDSVLSFIAGQYERLKSLGVRVLDRISQTQTPVTTDSLSSTPKTESALRKLFSADGPNLGASLSDANSLYNDILAAGVNLNAPISTPVLVERFDGDGKLLTKGFSWESDSTVSFLSRFPAGSNSTYPGSDVTEFALRDEKNKVVETTRFTIFSSYSTRRANTSDLSATISAVNVLIDKTSDIFKAELILAAKSVDDVQRMSLQSIQFQNESNQSINQARDARFEQREDALRRERIIRRERDLKGIQFDSTSGIPVANPPAKPGSEIALPVPLVDDSAPASGLEGSRNFNPNAGPDAIPGKSLAENLSAQRDQAITNARIKASD